MKLSKILLLGGGLLVLSRLSASTPPTPSYSGQGTSAQEAAGLESGEYSEEILAENKKFNEWYASTPATETEQEAAMSEVAHPQLAANLASYLHEKTLQETGPLMTDEVLRAGIEKYPATPQELITYAHTYYNYGLENWARAKSSGGEWIV